MPAQTEDGQICAKRGDEPNASWTSELRLIISCPGSAPEVRKSESGSGSGNFAQVQVRLGGRAWRLSQRSVSCLEARVAWLHLASGVRH